MSRRILAVLMALLLAVVGLTAPGGCGRDKRAQQAPPAGRTFNVPAPEIPVDVMPKLLQAPIAYPEEARRQRIQGTVQVKALVGKDGKVKEVSAAPDQSASPILTQAALDAVRQWTFEPARSKGEPCEIWIAVPVAFKLQK